ncbi:MAG TPA: hypothetical protein VFQ63_04360 [Patescibacteria group bacterium]|nr:hypothetical protein [Patescibacteria group bacterium]
MSKQRKTLKQKKQTDMKHTVNVSSSSYSYTFAPSSPVKTPSTTQYITSPNTSLVHDLQKTIYLSITILILQLAIFISLTHHILVLPLGMLRY